MNPPFAGSGNGGVFRELDEETTGICTKQM